MLRCIHACSNEASVGRKRKSERKCGQPEHIKQSYPSRSQSLSLSLCYTVGLGRGMTGPMRDPSWYGLNHGSLNWSDAAMNT